MGHTYTWDADGNMLSVDTSSVTMIYDAMDRMIEQTRGSAHTEIAYGPYGMKLALMNGQSLVNAFVKLPGGARAVYTSNGLAYYRHADHLGSSRLATTTSRTKYYDVAYAPYGEDYNGSGTQDLAFTDENQDTVAGGWAANLYDFMLREYRPAQGRWTSPDPAGSGAVDPTNPQTWNRYAYVINNPLALVDLLGDDYCYGGSSNRTITNSQWCGEAGGQWIVTTDPNPAGSCVANCGPPSNGSNPPPSCPANTTCQNQGGGKSGSGKPTPQPQPQPAPQPVNKEKVCANWNAGNYFAGAWALGFGFSGVGTVPGLIVGGVVGVSAAVQGIYCGL